MKKWVFVIFAVLLGLNFCVESTLAATTKLVSGILSNSPYNISRDGRYIVYIESASGALAIIDRTNMAITRADGLADDYPVEPTMSYDGRYIAYKGVPYYDVILWDKVTNYESALHYAGDVYGDSSIKISGDGNLVTFGTKEPVVPSDTNGKSDVYIVNRVTTAKELVSLGNSGNLGDGQSSESSINEDGKFVVFASTSSNLVNSDTNGVQDIFVRDRQSGTTSRVSVSSTGVQANGASYNPTVSSDGKYVTFTSSATNLVPNDTNGVDDVFIHDCQTGTTTRVSVSSSGEQSDGVSQAGAISGDGKFVVFQSNASNLVSGDTNGYTDVFIYGVQTGVTRRVSESSSGVQGNNQSISPSISYDGTVIAYGSYATNLVTNDTSDSALDLFAWNNTLPTIAGTSVTLTGTLSDAHSDTITLAASVGTIVNNGDGTWTWNCSISSLSQGQIVTVTANDGQGGVTSYKFAAPYMVD